MLMSSNTGFHNRAFDAGTLQKLNIYASYLKSAVAVFLNLPPTSPVKSINIYDFDIFFTSRTVDRLGLVSLVCIIFTSVTIF